MPHQVVNQQHIGGGYINPVGAVNADSPLGARALFVPNRCDRSREWDRNDTE